MHRLFNILAVVVGLAGGLLAWRLGRAAVDTMVWLRDGGLQAEYLLADIILITLFVGIMLACLWVSWKALNHLRTPGPGSRRDLVSMAIWMLVFLFVLPFSKQSGIWILLLIGLYYLRRYLLRQIALRDGVAN